MANGSSRIAPARASCTKRCRSCWALLTPDDRRDPLLLPQRYVPRMRTADSSTPLRSARNHKSIRLIVRSLVGALCRLPALTYSSLHPSRLAYVFLLEPAQPSGHDL